MPVYPQLSDLRPFHRGSGLIPSALWLSAVLFGLATGEAGGAPLAERFAQPPAANRILKIIHSWPDAADRQDELIRSLEAQGFGGVVCNVSFENYLEDGAKWAAFRRAVAAARQAGLSLWLYDEKGYPSANAGGLVLRDHPEWEARGLLVVDTETGPGRVVLTLPPGRLFLAAAFPARAGVLQLDAPVNLAAQVQAGRIEWEAPEGRWRVLAITESNLYEGTHADGNLHQKMPYPNLLEPAPTARFIELTHERYARELGPGLGRDFVATFTDEPSLMSLFLRRMPYRPLPWSASLAAEFRKRRGYALAPIVPALVAEAGPDSARYRHDYWQTVGELVAENFFGQIQTWCRRHGLRSGGHLLAEEGLTGHVPLYGDFFRCLRRLDAPSIDCLTSLPPEVPWHIARLAASAAELEGQPFVMCETSDHSQVYRPAGDTRPKRIVTEAEIRGTCNRLFVGGVNVITSYYSFAGLDGAALRRLNEWVGRCTTMLTGGHQVADVAVLYPIESVWTQFVPAPHWANASPGANRMEHLYRAALEGLFAGRRDFTIIDSRTLGEAEVDGDELVCGPLRWRAVVLPGVDTLPLKAWKRLETFVQAGGLVVALGARPANSEFRFPDRRVQALANRIIGRAGETTTSGTPPQGRAGMLLEAGLETLLSRVIDDALEPDVSLSDPRAPIRVTHRRLEGREVYFLINDSAQRWQGHIACRAGGPAERWDPGTGTSSAWQTRPEEVLSLEPYGAAILRFATSRAPRPAVPPRQLPRLTLSSLPVVAPLVARGEFVREEIAIDGERTRPDRPAWRVRSRLIKGEVDTFLFLRFPFPEGLDLSAAEFLEIESWVPPGQRTPTQLLVIVQETAGGDFLASTPRSLSGPGADRCYVPLDRLQLAGWSKDGDGVLDRRRISEIRIGWGGYVGSENEVIEMTVAAPRTGRESTRKAD